MKKLLQILVIAACAASGSAIAQEKKLRTSAEIAACLTKAGLEKGEDYRIVQDPNKVGRGEVELRAGLVDHPKFKDKREQILACK